MSQTPPLPSLDTSHRQNRPSRGARTVVYSWEGVALGVISIDSRPHEHIPNSTITIKPGNEPWFNEECRRSCQKQHQAYLKMRCQPSPFGEATKQDYLHARRHKQQVIDRAKQSHNQQIRSKLC
eukprot:g38920.t1